MSRISCDVTKDLLSGYLDETCSGESRGLVEEHLQECECCRKFLAVLREEDAGKEELKLNYLNRVRRFMDIQSLAGIFLPLLILLAGFYSVNRGLNFSELFYYLEMPVMMLLCAYALGKGRESRMPAGIQWLIPAAGVLLVSAAAVLRYVMIYEVTEYVQAVESESSNLGPVLHRGCLWIALGAAVLLIVLVALAKKKGKFLTVSANLAWLALNMVLMLDEELYNMSDLDTLRSYMAKNSLLLVLEFVLVTALLFLLRRLGPVKRMKIS